MHGIGQHVNPFVGLCITALLKEQANSNTWSSRDPYCIHFPAPPSSFLHGCIEKSPAGLVLSTSPNWPKSKILKKSIRLPSHWVLSLLLSATGVKALVSFETQDWSKKNKKAFWCFLGIKSSRGKQGSHNMTWLQPEWYLCPCLITCWHGDQVCFPWGQTPGLTQLFTPTLGIHPTACSHPHCLTSGKAISWCFWLAPQEPITYVRHCTGNSQICGKNTAGNNQENSM